MSVSVGQRELVIFIRGQYYKAVREYREAAVNAARLDGMYYGNADGRLEENKKKIDEANSLVNDARSDLEKFSNMFTAVVDMLIGVE